MTRHEPGITVTGIGQTAVTPDVVNVDLGISILADTVAEGRSRAAERARALIASVKDLGVGDDDIQTVRYSIQPEYDYRNGGQTLRGYRVSNDLGVTLRELGSAGNVLDAAAAAGEDEVTINNVSFRVEDETEARNSAREAAWADASARAEHLASLSGRSLGPAVDIVEVSGRLPGPAPMFRMAAVADESTPIESGSTMIEVTLQVRFTLT